MRTRNRSIGDRGTRDGATLVVVALLMAAVAMLSLSFLTVLRSSQKENQGSQESLSALYACEAGLSTALDDLVRGGSGTVGSQYNPVSFGDQDYWVTGTAIGNARTRFVAYGRDDQSQVGVELVVQPSPESLFRWAAFGDETMHMESSSRTDSYDSSLGTYASQQVNGSGSNAYANAEGDVGSNANITMDSNQGVYGDANPGPVGTVTQAGTPAGVITGNTTPLPTLIGLPNIIVPPIPTTGDLVVALSDNLPSGRYHYSQLQVNTNKTLTIIGPATIVCDNFRLQSGSKIVVNADYGPVKFYVLDDFVLNSNTSVASTEFSPMDVSFNLLSDNVLDPGVDVMFDEDLIDIDSGASIYGTIFAPSASITIDSNFELYGSLVARRVNLNSNCRIHYDELLAIASEEAKADFRTLCWRLVAQP